jgi:hypothetical protein
MTRLRQRMQEDHLTASLLNSRLFLRKIMLTRIPTQLRASTDSDPAFFARCLQSVP